MQPIKFARVEIRSPKWGHDESKTTTNNKEWKKGMFVVFKDSMGNEYDYMPRWDELVTINKCRDDIESLNKHLCAQRDTNG